MTQSELAASLGLDRSRVSEMLNPSRDNKPRRLQLSELPAISRALRMPIDEIVARATGDRGYRADSGKDLEQAADLTDPSAQRTYHATHDVLSVMTKHELLDMTSEEIHVYAMAIAQAATKPGLHDRTQLDAHLQDTVIHLWDFKAIRGAAPRSRPKPNVGAAKADYRKP